MTEPRRPRPSEPELDLREVLEDLGHTPESFARVVGRNASGLRRSIRGESHMTLSAATDIAEGLVVEGWEGDLLTIRQLSGALGRRSASPRLAELIGQTSTHRRPAPGTQISAALANLMRYLGREEVDRVYAKVFGARPDDKDK